MTPRAIEKYIMEAQLSAPSPSPAEIYFGTIERDLRHTARLLHGVKTDGCATLMATANWDEEAAAIAYFAYFLAGFKDLMDRLDVIWKEVVADDYYENKTWTTTNRFKAYLGQNWHDLGMPVAIREQHVQPAVAWLIWFIYIRGKQQ